ncbi:Homocysteine S-methyltransferase [Endogone sp. FLAS-F59071]|nr:Homocysteine S-methyltransferase [Endogone sp. FLAS-F59071]|eukprot:RUS12763.1 Homocysteine S-methyltransferase [Endogone sp. FLAS-F59071]
MFFVDCKQIQCPKLTDCLGPLILDGGLATELERSHHKDLSGHLWSAQCLQQDPHAIRVCDSIFARFSRRQFFSLLTRWLGPPNYTQNIQKCSTPCFSSAGGPSLVLQSRCQHSHDVQASFEGFARSAIPREQAEALMRRSVQIANEARTIFLSELEQSADHPPVRPLVALSLGCYGAMLANGSEYTGEYLDATTEQLVDFHRQRLRVFFAEPGIDLVAFETIPSLQEAEAIRQLLLAEPTPVPCWVSFSCRDDHRVSHGESLAECIARLHDVTSVAAVGINCTKPWHVESLLADVQDELNRVGSDKWIVVYPDGGDEWDAVARQWVSETAVVPRDFGDRARDWVRMFGPKIIIGGCCRTTPIHISCVRSMAHNDLIEGIDETQ